MKLTKVNFLNTIVSRLALLAIAARCGPHPRNRLATPLAHGAN